MRVIGLLFGIYRYLISPAIQAAFQIHCRYEESCSRYTERKIKELGIFRGSIAGIRRFMKCNPWLRQQVEN